MNNNVAAGSRHCFLCFDKTQSIFELHLFLSPKTALRWRQSSVGALKWRQCSSGLSEAAAAGGVKPVTSHVFRLSCDQKAATVFAFELPCLHFHARMDNLAARGRGKKPSSVYLNSLWIWTFVFSCDFRVKWTETFAVNRCICCQTAERDEAETHVDAFPEYITARVDRRGLSSWWSSAGGQGSPPQSLFSATAPPVTPCLCGEYPACLWPWQVIGIEREAFQLPGLQPGG